MIQKKFLKVAQEGHFFDKHKKVLVALSGGKDSVNVFHLLYEHQKTLGIQIGIAHVNHQQRVESIVEEQSIQELADSLNLPCYIDSFTGSFSEEAARKFRYTFFKELMEKEGYTALVTGHHADDQAETILMRLIRGSRLFHLAAMQPVQDFAHGELIRPLLTFSKADLQECTYFEDVSNTSLDFFRNRVRQLYLPQLLKENPRLPASLLHLGEEAALMREAIKELTASLDVTNVQQFQQQSPAVQSVLLQQYLESFPDLQVTRAQFAEIWKIVSTKANYQHYLKNGYYLFKDYRTMRISKIQPQTDSQIPHYVLQSDGIFPIGDYLFAYNTPLEGASQCLYFNNRQPITVRLRQAGDRIRLNGVEKKVSRYFIDQKIPKIDRDRALVIEQEDKIYGIATIATSDLSKSLKNDIIKSTLYIKRKE